METACRCDICEPKHYDLDVGRKQNMNPLVGHTWRATVEGAWRAGTPYAPLWTSPVEVLRRSERRRSSRLHQSDPITETKPQCCAIPCAKAASHRHGHHLGTTRRPSNCEFWDLALLVHTYRWESIPFGMERLILFLSSSMLQFIFVHLHFIRFQQPPTHPGVRGNT